MKLPLIIIAGPTGIGKTRVAIEAAERLRGEIVSADSMQIYRFMDIGTAKPTPEERARAPHHLLDIRDPDEAYSVADYVHDADAAIRAMHERGGVPLLVGGTGMYLEKLLYGIFEGPGKDEAFRAEWLNFAEERGNAALHDRLRQVDPAAAQRLHPNDRLRMIRALEVFHLTGAPISAQQVETLAPEHARYDACFIVLTAERDALYARIDARVDAMIAAGFVAEVAELRRRGYHRELHPMQSLGYKEIGEFLAGERDLASAVTLIKRNTRHYAKRQLTWFRKYADAQWLPADARACLRAIAAHHACSTGT